MSSLRSVRVRLFAFRRLCISRSGRRSACIIVAAVLAAACGDDYPSLIEATDAGSDTAPEASSDAESTGANGDAGGRGSSGKSGSDEDGSVDASTGDSSSPGTGSGGRGGAADGSSDGATTPDAGWDAAETVLDLDALHPGTVPFLNLPSNPDITPGNWTTEPAFPGVSFNNLTGLVQAPGTDYVFVHEREGRIFAVSTTAPTPSKKLVLDLFDVTQGQQDCGLLGLAFHPDFGNPSSPNGRFIYVHYAYTQNKLEPPVPANTLTHSRLSRFSVNLDTLVADPISEVVLINQADEHVWHQGGAMFFHPDDGFLYLTVGDEGKGLCALDNCQRIDRDLFGGVLRIDVDMRGGATSHPILRQPESGETAHYYIPNDNPFVGQEDVLEEFYALGLRSPHRMSYDPVDDIAWIGDVGENRLEELDVLARGANFQWNFFEGTSTRAQMSDMPLGVWTDPVLELDRDEAHAIIGGLVYRGSKFPELYGKYLFGDYYYGTIWALTYEFDGASVEVLEREQLLTGLLGKNSSVTSFGTDTAGEVYVLTIGSPTQVLRLARRGAPTEVPSKLSDVGAFVDVPSMTVEDGLLPYGVQSPLWSDGAYKRRWVALPEGKSVEFREHGAWAFPEGTVFVKHFEMALDERYPDVRRRLETRFLVAASEGRFYGVSYKWNDAQTDAEPLLFSLVETLDITQANGSVRRQSYFYPGPRDCLVCHNSSAGHVLGVRTAQLNGAFSYGHPGRTDNQLRTWNDLDVFAGSMDPDALDQFVRLANLGDESRTVEDRVRSYWDSNCSMCHGVNRDIAASWDARYETPLFEQGVIYGPLSGEAALGEDSFVVVPNDVEHSAMWQRDRSTDASLKMPPLARSRPDEAYLALLEEWIESTDVTICSNGVRDGSETSTDCGGYCPPCCTPVTYEAEEMIHSVGGAVDGGWGLWSNGYLEVSAVFGSAGSLVVTARGTVAQNTWPNMDVYIGDELIGSAAVNTAEFAEYRFPFSSDPGARSIRIRFTNDLNAQGEDRNLIVDKVTVACPSSEPE